jgi:Domain of unknown function (DUF5658)
VAPPSLGASFQGILRGTSARNVALFLMAGITFANILDVITTYLGLYLGFSESNATAVSLMSAYGFAGFAGVKLAIALAALIAYLFFKPRWSRMNAGLCFIVIIVAGVFCAVYIYAPLHNIYVIVSYYS